MVDISLFDGMSCGKIALVEAGVEPLEYHAWEIDKYAVKVASHNFPENIQHGDVFQGDFSRFKGNVRFLLGGSPCTYWSIAQSGKNEDGSSKRETQASGIGWELFQQYVRALHEAEPKFFIYENNKSMSSAIRQSINEAFGFEPVMINSALVSAQNRQRLYWVGKRVGDHYEKVDVPQPQDLGILLRDVLDGVAEREREREREPVALRRKARAVIASAGRTTEREYFMKNQGNMCAYRITGVET